MNFETNEVVEASQLDAAINAAIELRNRKSEITAKYKEQCAAIDAAIERLEAAVLGELDELGVTQIKSGSGLAYIETKRRPTCGDWGQLYNYIIAQHRPDLLQKRLSESAILEILDTTETLPPGVSLMQERNVIFRSPRA